MARSVFSHKDMARLSHEFVAVIAHGNSDHGEGDFLFEGKKTHLCNIYDLPSCKCHEDMRAALSKRNLLQGVRGTPTHIIYTPGLEEISRANYMTVGNIEDSIEAAQKKIGKPVTWKVFSKLHESIDEAKKAVAEKDYRSALRSLDDFDPKGMEGLKAEADALMQQILDAGREMIAKAKSALEAGDTGEAKKIFRDVSRHFGHTEVAKEAKKLLKEM